MNAILRQLARSGLLPDGDMVAALLAGAEPPSEELVLALVIGVLDAYAVIVGDRRADGLLKSIAHQHMAMTFLVAIACMQEKGLQQ